MSLNLPRIGFNLLYKHPDLWDGTILTELSRALRLNYPSYNFFDKKDYYV
jgi:hypothetical protein